MKTATSIEESKKLLSLGIDQETSDMYYCHYNHVLPNYTLIVGKARMESDLERESIPAWSLSALCELLPTLKLYKDSVGWEAWSIELVSRGETPFTACINLIEQLVEKGYIKTKKV